MTWTLLRRPAPGPYKPLHSARLLRVVKGMMIEHKAADRAESVRADYRIIRTASTRQAELEAAIAAASSKPFHTA